VIEDFLFYARIEQIASNEEAVKLVRARYIDRGSTHVGFLQRRKKENTTSSKACSGVHEGDAGIFQGYLTRVINELADNWISVLLRDIGYEVDEAVDGEGMTRAVEYRVNKKYCALQEVKC
jgi:hypothetical protein